MSLEKTDAIVLKTVEWSETSLVVTLFTKDFGKISAIAKGARRLKSP
ncbi:MAG: DNA repair protein RecO, partial [Planctomycetota bacterium]